ncbi:Tigger transposable element-derived protein [Trichinella spiralis]|uniref:Tigger transposable element-derived protein n=1 Tax=Trichinella spiralis TaxID=6334 RepID=A0ABR3KUC3_TRISP
MNDVAQLWLRYCRRRAVALCALDASLCIAKRKASSVNEKVAVTNALNDDAHENGITSTKRFRLCKKTDIDESLLEWFQEQSQIGTPISGPISKIIAEQFATMLGYTDFTCTTGWLDRQKYWRCSKDKKGCGGAI